MATVDFPQVPRLVVAPAGVTGTGTITVQVPDPAPGIEASDVWQIQAVTFRVVASATVSTRTPVVQVLDGTSVAIACAAAGFGITASLTTDYSYCRGLAEWDQSNNAFASGPAPLLPLDPGDSITISLGNADTTDAISRVRVVLAPFDY